MDLRATAGTRADIATGLFVFGGTLVASWIVVWLVTPTRPTRPAIGFAPAGNGAVIVGSF